MQIIKKINNNVAIGLDTTGKQVIVFGPGVGFPKIPYQLSDQTKIEKLFYDVDPQYLNLIDSIPEEILQIASKITELSSSRINKYLNPNLVMTLADHLTFAIHRYENNMQLDNPLMSEVIRLYEEEVRIGEIGLKMVQRQLQLELPYSEAISIALHIVNAEASAFDMQNTLKGTKILATTIKIIEQDYQIDFSTNEGAFTRLKTHLLLLRASPNDKRATALSNENRAISQLFKKEFPQVCQTVRKIAFLFQRERDWVLSEDEQLYLMLHIHRIIQSVKGEES